MSAPNEAFRTPRFASQLAMALFNRFRPFFRFLTIAVVAPVTASGCSAFAPQPVVAAGQPARAPSASEQVAVAGFTNGVKRVRTLRGTKVQGTTTISLASRHE